MSLVGDVKVGVDEKSLNFYRYPNEERGDMDIGGMAWYKENLSKSAGLKITFKPKITVDSNYFGLKKYPQGFAFVLTSNKNLDEMGEKKSGIGFEGLNNGIAFYFDFIQNNDRNESTDPHFSVAYNLAGEIKATCKDQNLCNKQIPNFYDNELDGFEETKISIEIYGGRLKVFFNNNESTIDEKFTAYSDLMNHREVFLGVSSSMNLYKGVKIEDLQFMKIVSNDLPSMEIMNPDNFVAGSDLILSFSKKSTCGKDLKIFNDDFNKIGLIINDGGDSSFSKKEEEGKFGILITLKNVNTVGTTKITGYWYSKPIKTLFLNVLPGKSIKFNICKPFIEPNSNVISNSAKISNKNFSFDICVSDKYKNKKSFEFTYLEDLIKIEYPDNIIPNTPIKYTSNKDKSIYSITIPTLRKGTYKIFNKNFFGEDIKLLEVIGDYPDYETSFGEIDNYLENRITTPKTQIYLNLFLKDSAGNEISNEEIKKFECSFKDSVVTHTSSKISKDIKLGDYSIIDEIATLYYSPVETGEYVFKPKMSCSKGQTAGDISCKDCKFYITNSQIENSNFQVFSDFYDEYLEINDMKKTKEPLIVSMEEEMNNKITTLLFLDTSGVPVQLSKIDGNIVTALSDIQIKLIDVGNQPINIRHILNPSNGIEIYTEKNDRNKLFSSLEEYKIVFSLNNKAFEIAEITIPLKFRHRDDFMNNVNNLDKNDFPKNFIVEYIPETFNLNAGSEQYLLRIISRNNKKEMTLGEKLNCDDLKMEVTITTNGKEEKIELEDRCFKSDLFLNQMVSFKKIGTYKIDLTYKSDKIFSLSNLIINPRPEIDNLTFNDKDPLIKEVKDNQIILKDIEVGKKFSFEMDIYDSFGNKIDKYMKGVLGQLTIDNTGEGSVTQAKDGNILLSGMEKLIGTYQIKIQVHSNTFIIQWKRISEKIESLNTGSELQIVNEKGSSHLIALIFPYDKFNEKISFKTLNDIKEDSIKKLEVYAKGPNGELIEFEYIKTDILKADEDFPYLQYKSKNNILIYGEYNLNSFYDDKVIVCQTCFINFLPNEKIVRKAKTTEIFLIDYKTFTRIPYENSRYEIFTKLNNFPIFTVFKDEFGNEIKDYSKKYEFGLYSEKEDQEQAKFCKTNMEQRERQYFEICRDYLKPVDELEEGNYYIATSEKSNWKFKIKIKKDFDGSKSISPSTINSFIRTENSVITGSSNNPARIVIDFRNDNNERYSQIDFTKIRMAMPGNGLKTVLSSSSPGINIFIGPIKGLVTILFSRSKVEDFKIDISYNNVDIIKDFQISFVSGKPARISLETEETRLDSEYRYNVFTAVDIAGNPVRNLNIYNDIIIENIMTVREKDSDIYHKPTFYYNMKSAKIVMKLKNEITNKLIINSYLLKEEIEIPELTTDYKFKNSFAYIDNINDSKVDEEFKIYINTVDRNFNKIKLTNDIINKNIDKFYLNMIYEGNDENHTEKFKFTNDNGIIFSKVNPSKAGNYYFTAYYDNDEINCSYCRKKIISNIYDLKFTSLKVKKGNSWVSKNVDNDYLLYKKNFPIFKIFLRDSTQSLYSGEEKIDDLIVDLVNEKEDKKITMNLYHTSEGIYSYMNEKGRNDYLNLEIKENLKLKISNKKNPELKIYFNNFILINSEVRTHNSTQCVFDIIPEFLGTESQFLTAGNQAFLEFKLTGCEKEENSLNDNVSDFSINICTGDSCEPVKGKKEWMYNVIPSDTYGKYILLIGSTKSNSNIDINLKYKNEKINSKNIKFEIVSSTEIASISYENYEIKNGFIFLKLVAKDIFRNAIQRDSTSCCFRDIFFDILDSQNNNLIYDLTYKPIANEYYVKLFTSEEKTFRINIPNSDKRIDAILNKKIEENIDNSIITFEKFNYEISSMKSIDFKIIFKNSNNIIQKINDLTQLNGILIKFTSIDTTNKQIYSISSTEITTKDFITFTIKFESDLILYNYFQIEFMNNMNKLICKNCRSIIERPDYLYSTVYQITENDVNIYNKSSNLIIRKGIDFPLIWYEGKFIKVELVTENNSEISSTQYLSNNKENEIRSTYFYFEQDKLPNEERINCKLVITYSNENKKEIPFIMLADESKGNEKYDLNETRLSGIRNREFRAGENENVFIELRGEDLQLTKHEPYISARREIKFNVLKTIIPGIYLVKYTVEKIPNLREFRILIDSNDINSIPVINLKLKREYPVKMTSSSLHSKNIVSERKVVFQLNILDKFDNIVCDRRINFEVITDQNMYGYILNWDSIKMICYIEMNFYGKAKIVSPLLGDIQLSIENNNQIYVSQTNSKIILNSNKYKTGEKVKIRTLIGNERKEFITFENIQLNIKMIIYHLLNSGQKVNIKEINTSSSYFELDTRNFDKDGNYLIKTIIENIEFRTYSSFKIYKDQDKENIDLEIKTQGRYDWQIVKDVYNQMDSLDEKEIFKFFPNSLMIRITDSDNNYISIPKKSTVKTEIITEYKTTLSLGYTSIINYSCDVIIIDLDKLSLNYLLHLPKGKYYLKISIETDKSFIKYIPINIKDAYHQNEEYKYHLPDKVLSKNYEVVGTNGVNTLYTNLDSYSTTNICFKFEDKIFNQYLDSSLIKLKDITSDVCNYRVSNSDYRGCVQISISCKSLTSKNNNLRAKIEYNSINSENEFTILVDPKLPPSKYEIIQEFPSNANQNTNFYAEFKVFDKDNQPYKYLNSENFELFDNNSKLKRNIEWKLLAGEDSTKVQLNLPFPPKIHNIRPLFKLSNMRYENIKELNKEISINQGGVNPSKPIVAIPIYYKSGDKLTFPIIMFDNFGNCFEEEVNINLMKLRIFDENINFDNFKFSNKTHSNTDTCAKYVEVSVENFEITKAKKYDLEFTYDSNKIVFKNKFEIFPNVLSIESSTISVKNKPEVDVLDIKAGENIEILIKGTDNNGNKVNYIEIIEKMKLEIGDLDEKNYEYSFTSDDEYIHIYLTINKPDLYKFNILVDGKQFNTKKVLTKLNVINGECINGKIELHKNKILIGEYGEIKISCFDVFKNPVTSIQDYEKNFIINIFEKNSTMSRSDMIPYTKTSVKDILTSNFLVLIKGNYEISTFLNGEKFGEKIEFNVIDEKCPAENPIMCFQRNCVQRPDQCSELISEKCNKEKPFYCWVGEEKQCVKNLETCTCKKDYKFCGGQCIHKDNTNLCKNQPIVDCKEGTEACFDGTCKPKGMCGNDMVCPLGYKMCGFKCINMELDCKFEEKKCDKITCWDFSCQNKYENCPTRKVCKNPNYKVCPDGTCAEKAEYCPQSPICPKSFGYLCPDFTCKKSEEDCNIKQVCPPGLALCEDNTCSSNCFTDNKCVNSKEKYLCKSGECVENIQLCPTDITCTPDKIRCSNGGACVDSIEECKFNFGENRITCPNNTPILCSDLTCVDELKNCNKTQTNKENCPNNTPYKCPNNECRRKLEECPTQKSCPKDFPSLCPDGTCHKAAYNCKNIIHEGQSQDNSNKFLCSNGIFANSISLCPTEVTCNKGMVKCWNGSCTLSISHCSQPKIIECQNPFLPYRCHDGECREKFEDCPTISVCPLSKPIKCLDGSCRESLELCPNVKECPQNYVSCPNGTCALPNKCSTLITCPSFKPFMCDSKKCVNDLRLCPKMKLCKGFICPDGECVSNRLDCMNIAPCSPNSPVRCDRGMCVDKIESCSNEFKCPVGYIVCKSGECKTNEDLCSPEECPVNTPYRCSNGECRMNVSQCDTEEGCPASLKTKCNFGTCKKDQDKCDSMQKEYLIKKNKTETFIEEFCPDGTEKIKGMKCPSKNGCFKDKPILCADGICVADSKECFTPKCRFNKPIQCQDGNCVIQATDCSLLNNQKDNYETCKNIGLEGYYMCADGICVSSPEYCKPIFDCPEGLSKCSDGTCRSSGFCPEVAESCPMDRIEKCNDGRCKSNKDSCNSLDLCSKNQFLCKDKSCANDPKECKDTQDSSRKCQIDNDPTKNIGYRCLDGRCLETKEKCFSINPACSIESPILCPDGTCKANYSLCKTVGCTDKNMIQCPNKLCVKKEEYLISCKNEIGCPLVKPYRCYDGLCVQRLEDCQISVKCPPSKPFVCADHRCVQNISFCNRNNNCAVDYIECPKNGLCSKTEDNCKNLNELCPLLSPIKCPNGLCVSDLTDCQESYLIEACKEGEFFCSLIGKCVNNKVDCIGLENLKGGPTSTNRLLQIDVVIEPENNCSTELPFSCFDGTCRSKKRDCPIPNSCLPGEIKCPDSKCVKDKTKCNFEKEQFECLNEFTKCNDGICRKTCLEFNGCPTENPYQCFNGRCVKNQVQCIGYSMCQNGYFRCFNGDCKKNPEDCEEIMRLYSPIKQTISASLHNKVEADLVLDNNKRPISNLYLPANSISVNSTNNYVEIKVEEVYQSTLRNLDYNYKQLDYFQFLISKTIIDSDGDLSYENSVLSPVINITCPDCDEKLKHPGILKMEHNFYNKKDITHENYCLAKLENNKWRCYDTIIDNKESNCNLGENENEKLCSSRKKKEDQDSFAIDSFGIYAVVLIPVNKEEKRSYGRNIIFDNLQAVIISAIITAFVIFILYHIFQRILRYRTKYLENKEKIRFKQGAVSDMMNIKLEFPGATVGDVTEKIQFIPNPAFKFVGLNKDPLKQKEEEIDRMTTQATQIDKINSELITEIEKIRDEYNEIRRMVEKTKGNH